MAQTVVILGASQKKDRYSYRAFQMLKSYGHEPLPVNPNLEVLEGAPVYPSLRDIHIFVDTLTMYVGPEVSSKLKEDILALKPKRVIFNPGSENLALAKTLEESGIRVVEACTLVLLRTNQFEKV